MRIPPPKRAEAIKPLVACEGLMASVVHKDQKVITVGLQFFVRYRMHRDGVPQDRTEIK